MKEKTEKIADKYLSVQSVAETLSCSDDYVYMLIRDGNLQAIKIGKRAIRISELSLQAFIAAGRLNPADYFSPPDPQPPSPEPEKPKIARSKWMNR